MGQAKRHLVTSALPYANGPLHIGHLAGAYLNADIYVRHLRNQGEDVLWVCGSDEHGAAITLKARKEGKDPQAIVDTYHRIIEKAFKGLRIDFDIYHRTSSELHHRTASDFFKELEEKGAFEKKQTEQYFDQEAGVFLADRYIQGTCPNCGHEDAYGDQCEKCGTSLSPIELANPRSTISGTAPVLKETTHWFLPMDRHEEWISEWLMEGTLDGHKHHDPSTWKKHVLGQCRAWIQAGLKPRAMTRDLDWGVPVPLDGAEGKVLYVWMDAPIGYISATKKWADDEGKDWRPYWQDEETELVHFIGKDNIVFHCIIFPMILKEHGGYVLPKQVPANGFLNLEGDKISTSRNHAVWLHSYLEDLPGREDELRYVLTSILPEMKDSEFTWDDYQARVNNELVAILGNFVNRCLVLTNKYFDGVVPVTKGNYTVPAELGGLFRDNEHEVDGHIRAFRFREALQTAMQGARAGNKFLAETEPWKLFKTDPNQVAEILHLGLRIIHHLERVLAPFLPSTSERLREMLGEAWSKEGVVSGKKLGGVSLLFKKVEDETMDEQRDKLKKSESQDLNLKPEISFDDFQKMDIRTGTIQSAEKVDGADKLLCLKVDLGIKSLQVVSGIAEHFGTNELAGRKVTLLMNLPPRKIRGKLSEAMILMAEDDSGTLSFVSPAQETPDGSEVR